MSRFLSRDLLHTGPPGCAAAAFLHCRRHLPQIALSRPPSQSPDATSAPSDGGDPQRSPTVSYLICSCGLSPEAALSASKKVGIETVDNPDAVLGLLRDSGFSTSQVTTIVSKLPSLLRMRVAETLEPKLECLRGAGISGPRLPELLCANPRILCHSLKRKIAPSLELLQRVLPPGVPVREALRLSPGLILNEYLPNVQSLRRHGISGARISELLLARSLERAGSTSRFEEIVAAVEAKGLDPASSIFPLAVWLMSRTTEATWDRKVSVYRSLGWSDGEISSAFVKQPFVMALSDELIRQKMDFLAGKLGMTVAALCKNPVLLLLSLEKRVAPRCAVLKLLMDRGFLREGQEVSLVSVLKMPEKGFLEMFVAKYMKEAPEVVDAHLGKVEFSGFGTPARCAEPPCARRR